MITRTSSNAGSLSPSDIVEPDRGGHSVLVRVNNGDYDVIELGYYARSDAADYSASGGDDGYCSYY